MKLPQATALFVGLVSLITCHGFSTTGFHSANDRRGTLLTRMSNVENETELLTPLAPPDPTQFQTRQQKRRNQPRANLVSNRKKKKRYSERQAEAAARELAAQSGGGGGEGEGEGGGKGARPPTAKIMTPLGVGVEQEDGSVLVPLVSVAKDKRSGEDYYLDPAAVARAEAPKPAPRPPAADQIADEKLREEIVSPYTNNYVGLIVAAVLVLVAVGELFPGLLETPTINFPQDL